MIPEEQWRVQGLLPEHCVEGAPVVSTARGTPLHPRWSRMPRHCEEGFAMRTTSAGVRRLRNEFRAMLGRKGKRRDMLVVSENPAPTGFGCGRMGRA